MANDYLKGLMGENERILLVTRQHWFVLFSNIMLEIILIVVLMAAAGAAAVFYPIAASVLSSCWSRWLE